MFEDAKNMFDEMPNRNCERTVNSLNALLSAAVDSEKFDKMEDLFKELETKWNMKPDIVTYNIMIKGYCKIGNFSTALDLVDEMVRDGVNPDLITYNTLFDHLYKNSSFVDAEKEWKRMIEDELSPNIRSSNSKLVGLVSERMFKQAEELISEMKKSGVYPDAFSYGALVKGHCSVGNVDEVKKWYSELVKKKFVPDKFVADRALFGTVLLCACENGDYYWCFELCKELFKKKLLVDSVVLQKVVDLFVKDSRIEEAKKVVHMGKSNDYHLYKLQLAEE